MMVKVMPRSTLSQTGWAPGEPGGGVYTAVVMRTFLIIVLALVGAPGVAARAEDPAAQLELVRPGRAQSAKPFEVPTPDGAKVSLADFRGRVVLLNFWATW